MVLEYISGNEIGLSNQVQTELLAALSEGQLHPAIFEAAYFEVYSSLSNGSFQDFLDWAINVEADPPNYTIDQIVTKTTPAPYSYDGIYRITKYFNGLVFLDFANYLKAKECAGELQFLTDVYTFQLASSILFPRHIPEVSNQTLRTNVSESPLSGFEPSKDTGGPVQPKEMSDQEFEKNTLTLKEMFSKIVSTYITVDSPSQVNLTAKRRKLIVKEFEEGSFDPDSLNPAYAMISSTLRLNYLTAFLKTQHELATLDALLKGMPVSR